MENSYYMQLKPIVEPFLKFYKQDFFEGDKKALRSFTGEFIFGMRDSGTNLLKFEGEVIPDDNFSERVEHFLFRSNDRFIYGTGGKIKEITLEKARQIYESSKKKSMFFYL